MEKEIEDIYSELVYARREHDPAYERIYQSILQAAQRGKTSLRPDAVFFLANNISEMIVTPLHLARVRGVKVQTTAKLASEEEVYTAVGTDLDVIVSSAVTAAQQREAPRISAASVIVGLGNVIDSLKVNDWKLWGRPDVSPPRPPPHRHRG